MLTLGVSPVRRHLHTLLGNVTTSLWVVNSAHEDIVGGPVGAR